MYEALNQWDFVLMAYVVGIMGTLGLVLWSWYSMRQAEAKRDNIKRSGTKRQ